MARIKQLKEVLEDYKKTPVRIDLIWSDGSKAGVGNKEAINAAMGALRNELINQIKELENYGA